MGIKWKEIKFDNAFADIIESIGVPRYNRYDKPIFQKSKL